MTLLAEALHQHSNHAEQNSPLRPLTEWASRKAAEFFRAVLPEGTSADVLTISGLLGTVAISILARRNNLQPHERQKIYRIILGLSQVAFLLLDGVDGPYSRLLAEESSVPPDPLHGQIVDAVSDGGGETAQGESRAVAAHERKHLVGEVLAYLATITNGIPRILRAKAASYGRSVKESGRNPLEFIGTRAGRAILGTIGMIFPTINGHTIQPALDGVTSLGNIASSISRYRIWQKARKGELELELNPKEQANAAARARALILLEFGIVGVTALTAVLLNAPWKKDGI